MVNPEQGVHATLDINGAADLSNMQRFEADLQQYLPAETERRPSAMCLWEVCPALLGGTVNLPTIEEDTADSCFQTIEGWTVRDTWKSNALAEASTRARRLGIEGCLGRSSSAGRRPGSAVSLSALTRTTAEACSFPAR